jgi:hypothetical protein
LGLWYLWVLGQHLVTFAQNSSAHFAWLGMAASRSLRIQQFTVNGYFKRAPLTGDQSPRSDINLDITLAQDLSRQTDGSCRVVSYSAVFKRHFQ